jgi:regulator of ribonuclease activity A
LTATADLLDEHGDRATVCGIPLVSFGGARIFEGRVATVRCFEDNVLVKQRVGEPGEGRVLVVDGGGSFRVALVGDKLAGLAAVNGWAGLVINGCVRDSAALGRLDLGVVALGTNPRPSTKNGDGDVDIPVAFGGVTFHPGDRLYRDDDGIVVLNQNG